MEKRKNVHKDRKFMYERKKIILLTLVKTAMRFKTAGRN